MKGHLRVGNCFGENWRKEQEKRNLELDKEILKLRKKNKKVKMLNPKRIDAKCI